MEEVYMLTTKDNPYSPFTHYDEWNAWDVSHGYNTSAYLARISKDSSDLSPAQSQTAVNDAIDEIVYFNLTGNYMKVSEDDYTDWHPTNGIADDDAID